MPATWLPTLPTGIALFFVVVASDLDRVSAMDIRRITPPGVRNVEMIEIRGDVVPGDLVRFLRALEGIQSASIFLSGDGGDIEEALSVSSEIRLRGFTTNVLPDMTCASACALIWLAGVRRYMSESSRIGFHAAYRIVDGKPVETGMGNADIGSFLTHLGLSRDAIRFISSAAPDEIRWLSLADARRLGIAIYEQRGLQVVPPR